MRPLLSLLVMAALTCLMLLLIAGHGPWAGQTVWQVTGNHGLNLGDVPVVVVWLVGVSAAGVLARDER